MRGLLSAVVTHKVAVAGIAGALVVGGAVVSRGGEGVEATVTHVVDGDTIDVLRDGVQHRVRLLNVDTPVPAVPGGPACPSGADPPA